MRKGRTEPVGLAWRKSPTAILLLCCSLLGGCVVLEEKYNAEKARSLNFQRLLAQEERRTAELESEVKRTKNELAEFEARNRELLGQLQAIREQMSRLQEETEAIKESALLERKAMEEVRKIGGSGAQPKKPELPEEPAAPIEEAQSTALSSQGGKTLERVGETAPAVKGGPLVHVVKPGETLYRISRRYGIEVEQLRRLNKLANDIIEVGQRLIVGTE